jgi:hypothetical protein
MPSFVGFIIGPSLFSVEYFNKFTASQREQGESIPYFRSTLASFTRRAMINSQSLCVRKGQRC